MALTLLRIVQAAQNELGLPQATTVVGNPDATTVQMFALANRVLDELRRQQPTGWQVCQFEYDLVVQVPVQTTGTLTENSAVITNLGSTTGVTANFWSVIGDGIPTGARVLSVDSATQVTMNMEYTGDTATGATVSFARDTYPMPSDYDWTQDRTMWDRTNQWELLGPDSPQIDQWHRSGIVTAGPRRHFRQLGPYGSQWRIWPPPFEITNPLQLVFEYLSLNAVQVNATTVSYSQYFNSDSDTPLLDDQAIVMGIQWMFFRIKGFNYAEMKNDWLDYVQKLIARDGAAPTLNLAKRQTPIFLSPSNVQDGNYPGPVGSNTG